MSDILSYGWVGVEICLRMQILVFSNARSDDEYFSGFIVIPRLSTEISRHAK